MQLFYIVIICFVGLSHGFEKGNPLLQALTGSQIARAAACGEPGVFSNAKCLSQTKFIFNDDDPDTAALLECEAGTVCVDKPGICFSGVNPLCSNTVPLDPAYPKCSVCETATTKYACISQTSYVTCVYGEPLTQYPQKCPTDKYCKAAASGTQCSISLASESDCKNAVVAPPAATPAQRSGSGSSGCTTVGLFPTAGDTTCRGYYSCYKDTNGQLVKTTYTCSGTLIFNPTTQRCVSTTAYTCPR